MSSHKGKLHFGEYPTNFNKGAEEAPSNPFGFTGEYTEQTIKHDYDAVATVINLRARNYDPDTGRFTSRDPYVPDATTPYTQPYAYVENRPTSRTDPSGMCSITTQMKDLFTGNFGWNNNCAQEDRETAAKSPAAQSAKALSDNLTKAGVEVFGNTGIGLLDGLTLGGFSYLTGAQITCPPAYNVGLYASMVPFPVTGGGKRFAAEVAERGLWRLTAEGSSKIMKGGPFKTTFYKSSSDATWWTSDITGHGGSTFKVYRETKKGLEWIADADRYGTYMEHKWKGETGRFIPWSQLRGVAK